MRHSGGHGGTQLIRRLRCTCLGLATMRGTPQPLTHCVRRYSRLNERRQTPCFVPPLVVSRRHLLVTFHKTPNIECYRFAAEGTLFLPTGSETLRFDHRNSYQSPLAHHILEALPMVEEVTIGSSFVTVKRVESATAAAAARLFAQRLQQNDGATASPPGTVQPDDATWVAGTAHNATVNNTTSNPTLQSCDAVDEDALRSLITDTSWDELRLHVSALLTDHLYSGAPHVDAAVPHPHRDTLPAEGDSELVLMIKELVAETIRPQLQEDGGDVRFIRYAPESRVMEVELLGACRSCHNSRTTLVDLIERTTRHWLPEVAEVRAVEPEAAFLRTFMQEMQLHNDASVCSSKDVNQTQDGAAHRVTVRDDPERGARVVRSVPAR